MLNRQPRPKQSFGSGCCPSSPRVPWPGDLERSPASVRTPDQRRPGRSEGLEPARPRPHPAPATLAASRRNRAAGDSDHAAQFAPGPARSPGADARSGADQAALGRSHELISAVATMPKQQLDDATGLERATSSVIGRTKFNDFNASCDVLAPASCSKRQKSRNSEGTGIEARRTPDDHFGDEAQHIELTAAGNRGEIDYCGVDWSALISRPERLRRARHCGCRNRNPLACGVFSGQTGCATGRPSTCCEFVAPRRLNRRYINESGEV